MNISLHIQPRINEWITISIKRRKDGDDERPAIHIYIGGSKTCHDATHCVIWPIKIQTIHQPFLVCCYSVHGCKAHSNRKVRWDGVIGVVFQSWSPEKSDFTMTHLKCYFYKERKNQSLWVTFYFLFPRGNYLVENNKKCHKFVIPTARELHPRLGPSQFFWKVWIGPLPIRQRSSSLTEGIQPKSMSRTVKGFVLCEGVRILRLGIFSLCSTFWALSCMLMNYPWTPTHLYSQISFISNSKLQWVRRAKISKCARTSKRWQMKNWRGERKGKQDSFTQLVNRLQKIEQGRFFKLLQFAIPLKSVF